MILLQSKASKISFISKCNVALFFISFVYYARREWGYFYYNTCPHCSVSILKGTCIKKKHLSFVLLLPYCKLFNLKRYFAYNLCNVWKHLLYIEIISFLIFNVMNSFIHTLKKIQHRISSNAPSNFYLHLRFKSVKCTGTGNMNGSH